MASQQTFIPVGEYRLSDNADERLVTILGSCVAVCLYDPEKKIGGMIHIVLPGSRHKIRSQDQFSFYADSGIPYLYESLIQKGATRKNLVAGITGGASSVSNPVTQTIGEKNAAVAVSLVEQFHTPIAHMDIGGHSARKVIFHLKTGTLDIKPIQLAEVRVKPTIPDPEPIHLPHVSFLSKPLESLPPFSHTAEHLLQTIHDPDKKITDILEILFHDAVLAFQIIRLCNSAFYGLPGNISSIQDAVRFIGDRQFRLICVVAATQRHEKESTISDSFLKAVSRHMHAMAIIVSHLSSDPGSDLGPEFKHKSVTAALLLAVFPLADVLEDQSSIRNEKKRFLNTVQVLRRWNIPDELIHGITRFKSVSSEDELADPIARILYRSYRISLILGLEPDPFICVHPDLNAFLNPVPLDENLETLMPHIINRLTAAKIKIPYCNSQGQR